jgi:hypothetical protein
LIGQPFPDVPFDRPRGLGQFRRLVHRSCASARYQPEFVADLDQYGAHRGAENPDRPSQEFVQLAFVDSHGGSFARGHRAGGPQDESYSPTARTAGFAQRLGRHHWAPWQVML